MKTEYVQLMRLVFGVNAFLFAFGFFTLCFVIAILAAVQIAGLYNPAFYIPGADFKPLILMVLVILKFYFLWSVFSLGFQITKSMDINFSIGQLMLEPIRKLRQLLFAIFFISAVIYFLELPQLLGPFENFFRIGPTTRGLNDYTLWQSSLYYLFKIVSFEISGVVALIFAMCTFVLEILVQQNRKLQSELEEVI
jgi:hypothetical protein